MSKTEICLLYLQRYAEKNLPAVAEMFADNIVLRDWKIIVRGKDLAVAETQKNFISVDSITIEPLFVHEAGDTVVAELKILINNIEELYVVDIITLDSDGKIKSIRAYLGRGED
ncbi:MAG TPA: nuclear transport factor 2 family protein [Cellvibrio sp.]|nr:nuclear transport factor 2 family protein [Cellvibrio sp.]